MLYTYSLGDDADDATKIITALMPLAQIGAVGLLNKDALAAPGVVGALTGRAGQQMTQQYNMGPVDAPAPSGWLAPVLIGGGVLVMGGLIWAMSR